MDNEEIDLLLSLTGQRSVRAIALQARFDPSTLTRQLKSGLKAETLIEIARAFDLPTITMLVEFGFLTEDEVEAVSTRGALSTATDEELAQEILDRVKKGSAETTLTRPMAVEPENVTRLDDHRSIDVNDELAAASERSADENDHHDNFDA